MVHTTLKTRSETVHNCPNTVPFLRKLDGVNFHIQTTFERLYFAEEVLKLPTETHLDPQMFQFDDIYRWLTHIPDTAKHLVAARNILPIIKQNYAIYDVTDEKLLRRIAVNLWQMHQTHNELQPDLKTQRRWIRIFTLYLYAHYIDQSTDEHNIPYKQHYQKIWDTQLKQHAQNLPTIADVWKKAAVIRANYNTVATTMSELADLI